MFLFFISQVAFSDEKQFLIWGDKPIRVWRRKGNRFDANYTRKTMQSKRGIMVWLALKADGTSRLIRLTRTLDSAAYQQDILTPALSFIKGTRTTRGRVYFQQDNAPPHFSRSTTRFLAEKGVCMLADWPPDLNVAENAWAAILRELVGKSFPTEDVLWAAIQVAWQKVPASFVRKLWDSIPRRLEGVRRARGAATRC